MRLRWRYLTQDRPTPFVVAWPFGRAEGKGAPQVVRRTRHGTHQQAGVAWGGDGRAVYRRAICRPYRTHNVWGGAGVRRRCRHLRSG